MNWEVIGVGLAGLFVLGGFALMASASRTKEDWRWGDFDPEHLGPGESIVRVVRTGEILKVTIAEYRVPIILNEIGNEVEREVFSSEVLW